MKPSTLINTLLIAVLTAIASAAAAATCTLPPGTIGLGNYCHSETAAAQTTAQAPAPVVAAMPAIASTALPEWFITPEDQLLSKALTRWAEQAKLKLTWSVDVDFPVAVKRSRRYVGLLPDAVAGVLADVGKSGIPLTYTLVGNELTIKGTGI